jgi:type IV/VI secretion system ImpK/VasF family protein
MQRAFNESLNVRSIRRRARQHDDLVGLAAPVLEVVLLLRAGLYTPQPGELRDRVDGMLTELERQGANLRYSHEQVQAVKYALASFVDETVLDPSSPLRDEWEKLALQLKHFGDQNAGVAFFTRLEELLRRAEQAADAEAPKFAEAAEVYYLCLITGFKGRYAPPFLRPHLEVEVANTARRLRDLGRLEAGGLSPHWRQDDQPEPGRDPGLPRWSKIGLAALLAATVLLFFVLKFVLEGKANDVQQQLLR